MSEVLVSNLSPTGYRVLLALAEYRFLTISQLIQIGVAKDRGYIGQVLTSLLSVANKKSGKKRRPKEIGELDFGVLVGRGRLPRVYYLTERGAELIQIVNPDRPLARFPRRVVRYQNDFYHRVATVDFHIILQSWAKSSGQNLLSMRQYFDWTDQRGEQRPHTETQIRLTDRNINPDSIFRLRDSDESERVFCVEVANGLDTGRVIRQMRNYCLGFDDGSINRALRFGNRAVRVLFLFEHTRLLELVQKASKRENWLNVYAPHFFLKSQGDLDAKFFRSGWGGLKEPGVRDLF